MFAESRVHDRRTFSLLAIPRRSESSSPPPHSGQSSTRLLSGRLWREGADQLIRNARVGLRENGRFTEDVLFDLPPRDFVLILLTPTSGNPLVQEYRNRDRLRSAIPHAERLKALPRSPFIGELSYRSVIDILSEQQRWFSLPERRLIEELNEYLRFKLTMLARMNGGSH